MTEIGSTITPISIETLGLNCNQVYFKAIIFWYTPFTFPSRKKYCLAATKDRTVEVNREAVEIIPAVLAKYLRPNKPNTTKVARGNKGIQSIYK